MRLPPLPVPRARPPEAGRIVAALAAAVLNQLMRGQEIAERLPALEGRRLGLDVTDLSLKPVWRVLRGRLVPAAAAPEPEVLIRGTTRGFLSLALRFEDPDTLFFRRTLCLEGETESGLYIKNLLDALEPDLEAHLTDVLGPSVGPSLARAVERTGLARQAGEVTEYLRRGLERRIGQPAPGTGRPPSADIPDPLER